MSGVGSLILIFWTTSILLVALLYPEVHKFCLDGRLLCFQCFNLALVIR